MPSAIIGSNGFIGSALLYFAKTYLEEEWIGINRDNYSFWKGQKFNKVVWAAGQSSKIKCEQQKEECFKANYTDLINAIEDFPAKQFIYISSYDIYPVNIMEKDESYVHYDPNQFPSSYYGGTKFAGEQALINKDNNYLILRCNGFTGPGLKKNAVFDIAATNRLWVSWDSRFQYIHVDVFAQILFSLATKYSMAIFNLTSPDHITPVKIAEICGKDIKEIKQSKSIVLPRVQAILPVNKMLNALEKLSIPIPSSEEAVKYWNARYSFNYLI